ncbi:hypothetical protein KL929_002083 [Ogataea haglerorum]|nr:hypothetical protein KL914_002467 [Ogataea haglerorum]KAG7738658.1 hypothetical protein KL932_003551 [Ogataea haglerorum]KAG7739613.1 hypothetical protein KL923_002460 [Ogataea haglerorum]KAG7748922.1 hypothetical protein KL912_001984 [Ogataea haglerorum]KAG7759602.1 hypothetical protein KL947_001983 [Ogataea haglerorum]
MAIENPALQMLGIKKLKLPSRNWMIFWTVVAAVGGGIVYDKRQQSVLRAQYMEKAKHFGQQPFLPNQLPRKLRIYVAPPPNDFLSEGLKYLRRFCKPILNSAAIDFDIYTAERQGDIRHAVSEEIRQIRRSRLCRAAKEEPEPKAEPVDPEATKPLKELFRPADVLGIFKCTPQQPLSYEDAGRSPEDAGGVITIGRGAFKEYINGVHEGLLGPLEKPEKKEESADSEEQQDEKMPEPVAQPYIAPADYPSAPLAPELDFNNLRDENGVPYFFTQPILALQNYNVAGFTKQPERIYRFYHKRYQLIEYNERLWGLITKNSRPFTPEDMKLLESEENDWPRRFVKESREKGSEWTRDFVADPRVLQLLRVYDKIESTRE